MKIQENYRPEARREDLIVEDLDGETVVYDLRTHKVYCLNAAAAFVWKQSDGSRSIPELAAGLEKSTGLPAAEEVVQLGLARLGASQLLEKRERYPVATRRQVIQRFALKTALVAMLPAVTAVQAKDKGAIASCVARSFCLLPQNACAPCYNSSQPNENHCESRRCHNGDCRPHGDTNCP